MLDDDRDYADSLSEWVAMTSDWQPCIACTVADGLRLARAHRPDAMLLDLDIPPSSGFEMADALQEVYPRDMPVLVAVSANATLLEVAAHDERFAQVLLKPPDTERLMAWLGQVVPRPDRH